jgi:hypothetical protein
MPTLKLTKSSKELQLLNITAIMCFPSEKEEDKRRYWSLKQWLGIAADQFNRIAKKEGYSEELSKHIGAWLGGAIFHVGSWPALANAVIGPKQKKPPANEASFYMKKHGIITGYILKDILKIGGGISTAAKRFCVDEKHRLSKKIGIELPNYTPDLIHEKIWNEKKYKDVAHLWAAFFDGCLKPKKPHRFLPLDQFKYDRLSHYEPQGLKGFIRLSEIYWKTGVNYYPPNKQKSLLDKETTWKFII